jgi:hypothetical protein
MEKKLLAALRARACDGACRLDDRKALAKELGISVGKLSGLLYSLCGEGKILQEGNIILVLSE